MTLPEFAYPDQRPEYCEGLARRILNESDRFPSWGAAMGEWGAAMEHDDLMDADDYDRRRAMRDGWASDTQGRY